MTVLTMNEEDPTILLCYYYEDELMKVLNEEQRRVEQLDRELELAKLKAKEILAQLQAVKQYIAANGTKIFLL